jgi:hypothetical protein
MFGMHRASKGQRAVLFGGFHAARVRGGEEGEFSHWVCR